MATVKVYKGKRKTSYQLTLYKGYITDNNGKKKQIKETVTYTLEEMGISGISDKGNPRKESTILKDVQLYADNLEKRLTGVDYTKGDKIKFMDFYEQTWKPWAENHFSPSTYYSYTRHIDEIIMPEIGTLKIGKITPERLSAVYLKLSKGGRRDGKEGGYARRSIIAFHKHLQSVMALAKKYKLIEENPCLSVDFPKIDEGEKVKYLTLEQALTFLDILDNPAPSVVHSFYKDWNKECVKVYDFCAKELSRLQYNTYKALFRIALFSGCRIGELRALTWKDIDFDNRKISITKSVAYAKSMGGLFIKPPKTPKSIRTVTIEQSEIDLLKALQHEQKENIMRLGTAWEGQKDKKHLDENLVFPQVNGKIMCHSSPNRIIHRLIDNYNSTVSEEKRLPHISVHCLRHTHATLLIAGDMDVKTISSRLGHKNIQTTLNIYAHPLEERDGQASEVLGNLLKPKNQKQA